MKGSLTVDQQLAVLARIWGNDRDGFVFLPTIPGKCKTKEERRKGYDEGPAFEWPKDKDKIAEHLAAHDNDDVYFAPCMFEDSRRREEMATAERALWADLDEVDPETIDVQLRPTVAWQSSPGRYQAVWLLDRPRIGLSWAGDVNHRLTTYLGADASGWDTTQLLRVPGRDNHKPDYKSGNGGAPVPGQLLWDTGPRYTGDQFDSLPTVDIVELTGDIDLMDAEIIESVDRHDVWARVRLKLNAKVREFMAVRTARQADEIGGEQPEGRSGVQWQIMCELAEAGCTVAEIVAVVRPTVWNTFAGRTDELKRLKIGAAKAVAKYRADEHAGDDNGGALETLGDDKPDIRWLSDVMAVRMRRPRWLVHNVWSDGGCGFVAGDPKSYKSWMSLDLAVSIATGHDFLGDPSFAVVGGARPMLYLQEEDSELVVRERLDNIVNGRCPTLHWDGYVSRDVDGAVYWSPADGNIPLGFHVRTGFIASDPGWQSWLMDMCTTHNFAGVVIDTLGTTAGDVDTDRAQELMTKVLRPMREVSHLTGVAVIVVHHNRKSSTNGERGGQRMLGSVALHAWVDDAMYVHSRETMKNGRTKVRVERESKAAVEHKWVLEVPRMGLAPDGTRVMWEPCTGLWDASEGGVTGDHDIPTPRRARGNYPMAGQKIANRIASSGGRSHPVPIERLMEVTGNSRSTVKEQVQSAIDNGLAVEDPEGRGYLVI